MINHCPICGSNNFSDFIETEMINVPYGMHGEVKKTLSKCLNCGEVSFFSERNNAENNKSALDALKRDSIKNMIDYLSDRSINMAYFERSLQLPQRTLMRWKKDGCSASSIALLRIVRTYPWVLKVADESFDELASKKELVNQAFQTFIEMKDENTVFSMKGIENGISFQIVQSDSRNFQMPTFAGSEKSGLVQYSISAPR
jgi:hypothetical protein